MSDEPIEEQPYLYGTTVVDIGDLRVARGMTRRPASSCRHARLTYDPRERRIWCKDCEKDVDPFDAFTVLVEQYDRACKDINKRADEIDEASRFQCRSLAAKKVDEVWRRRKVVPACPSCGHGIFPEDYADGVPTVGREYALARRKAAKK
ncbi:hypothetical protein [Shinella zoogloeoides]